MKTLAIAVAVAALGAGSALASPFDGTWKLDVAKSKLTGDTFTYTKTATGFRFSNGATVDYAFAMDGKDYPTIADRTVSWSSDGKGAWDIVTKAHGKVVSRAHRALSADGKTMNATYTEYRANGSTTHEGDVFTRVSGGPGLAGVWKDTKAQAVSDTMVISTPGSGRFMISYPTDKETISGHLGGAPAPIVGPNVPPGAMSSYKPAGPNRWEYDVTLKGKVYAKGILATSADGKSLSRTSWVPGKESEKSVEVWVKS